MHYSLPWLDCIARPRDRCAQPPPMYGKDVKVVLKKQGWFDADFDVLDEDNPNEKGDPKKWMLCDAVGSISDSAYDYYLKYRATGMEKSMILGCANMKKEEDYLCTPLAACEPALPVPRRPVCAPRPSTLTSFPPPAACLFRVPRPLFSSELRIPPEHSQSTQHPMGGQGGVGKVDHRAACTPLRGPARRGCGGRA